jgi:hypothetical protein
MVASAGTAAQVVPVASAQWERVQTPLAVPVAMAAYPACQERGVSQAREEQEVRSDRPVFRATVATAELEEMVTPARQEWMQHRPVQQLRVGMAAWEVWAEMVQPSLVDEEEMVAKAGEAAQAALVVPASPRISIPMAQQAVTQELVAPVEPVDHQMSEQVDVVATAGEAARRALVVEVPLQVTVELVEPVEMVVLVVLVVLV